MPSEFLSCPFCGETTKLDLDFDDGPQTRFGGWAVMCDQCGARGPADDSRSDDRSRDQAVANWNRRPTSTLVGGGSGPQPAGGGAGARIIVGPPSPLAGGGGGGSGENAIKHTKVGGIVLTTTLLTPDEFDRRTAEIDDLAIARANRELAGLPSVEVTISDGGVSMDFDLGGEPKKR